MSAAGADLASVIADLTGSLPPAHITAWAGVLRYEPQVDARTCARLIEARPGGATSAAATRLVEARRAAGPALPGIAITLALEAAANLAAQAAARQSEVVVSGPTSDSEAVRLTSSVISELVHDSRQSLLMVSFAAFGVADIVQELRLAARRGVRIDLVLEGTTDQGGTLRGPAGAGAREIQRHSRWWHAGADGGQARVPRGATHACG